MQSSKQNIGVFPEGIHLQEGTPAKAWNNLEDLFRISNVVTFGSYMIYLKLCKLNSLCLLSCALSFPSFLINIIMGLIKCKTSTLKSTSSDNQNTDLLTLKGV